jgi:hypothetical protein
MNHSGHGKSYLFSGSNAEMQMTWRDELLDQLAAAVPCGYLRQGPPATEPTCMAAIALSLSGRTEPSSQALQWLASIQNDDGSLGPASGLAAPGWPSALAVLASAYAGGGGSHDVLGLGGDLDPSSDVRTKAEQPFSVGRAVEWLLAAKGTTIKRSPEMAHNSMLVGWPWVPGTHSWVEPTALAVLALKAIGEVNHPRTREGVRVLHDRLLPGGGCNCGNTIVFGQELLAHVQPTGLTLLALDGETDHDGRIARSLAYLQREVDAASAAASMAYGVWALARYGKSPRNAPAWLAAAARRGATQESPLRMALLVLASLALECGDLSPLSLSNHANERTFVGDAISL